MTNKQLIKTANLMHENFYKMDRVDKLKIWFKELTSKEQKDLTNTVEILFDNDFAKELKAF